MAAASHIELLVEEPSAALALEILVPRIVGAGATLRVRSFQGKHDLLKQLPTMLRGYRAWLPAAARIVVLVDRDQQDCLELKQTLERHAAGAGFATRSRRGTDGVFQVVNRIAVEELEAWFLGDVGALAEAFPRVPRTLGNRRGFRDPDAVAGGTAEALARVLRQAGYFRGGVAKTKVAREVASRMDPAVNTSRSFQLFRDSLRELVAP